MKKAADTVQVVAPSPELIVDQDILLPPPLDRRIASVLLRTKTNDVTEGYDLTLSASFGRERITLVSGDLELSVIFAIRSADIILKFVHSDHRVLDGAATQYSEAWRGAASASTTQRRHSAKAGTISVGGSVAPAHFGVKLSGSAKFEAMQKDEVNAHAAVLRPLLDWHLMGDDGIKVGRSGDILDGPIIADLTSWHLKPRSKDRRSGVVAKILVREDWVEFSEPQEIKTPKKFLQQLADLFSSAKVARRSHFMQLLRHLAHVRLQEDDHARDATLAMAALVVKPNDKDAMSRGTRIGGRTIRLPETPIEQFLFSEPGREVETLIALGVSPDVLGDDRGSRAPQTIALQFVPQSSPLKAMAAFGALNKLDKALTYPEAVRRFGRNEMRDLSALGLVKLRKGVIHLGIKRLDEPEPYLRHAIGRTTSIAAARAVLRANPSADAELFAVAVANAIGKKWDNKATLNRHGRTIRRWTLWLEPHLIDPASPDNAQLVAGALSPKTTRGARTKLTDGLADRIGRLVADGLSDGNIAHEIGVSVGALKNYRRKLGI